MFIAALFTIVKLWQQTQGPSTDEWIKKMWITLQHTHIHNGLLLSHKKVLNFVICSNMHGLGSH